MKEKLANLALMAGGSDLVEAARYYEDLPGQADKAVMLYHKVRYSYWQPIPFNNYAIFL